MIIDMAEWQVCIEDGRHLFEGQVAPFSAGTTHSSTFYEYDLTEFITFYAELV